MPALITGSAIRTCLGDGPSTYSALLQGQSGLSDLAYFQPSKLNVKSGYQIKEAVQEQSFRASRWLTSCIADALVQAEVDPWHQRVIVLVGTGLRELRSVELWTLRNLDIPLERLHFAPAISEIFPGVRQVVTLSNACSASGHALALAQDLIELGEADAVVAAGTDAITESMLVMIGRFAEVPTERVRPFDLARTGTLLGEGAAAVVVVPESHESAAQALARLLSTGLSCDAYHETSPDLDGITRAMLDALSRAHRSPTQVDLVVAHGTGTALNEPAEARLIRNVLASQGPGPLITAIKGATGHTSGASALMSVDVAIRCLKSGMVPPIVGLDHRLDEATGLRFVVGTPAWATMRLANIDAFGFGGVNSVTLIEAVA